MKAMVLTAYDKLELVELPTPTPGPGEVLCRIKSVAICGSDPKMIHGHYQFTNWPPSGVFAWPWSSFCAVPLSFTA